MLAAAAHPLFAGAPRCCSDPFEAVRRPARANVGQRPADGRAYQETSGAPLAMSADLQKAALALIRRRGQYATLFIDAQIRSFERRGEDVDANHWRELLALVRKLQKNG